MKAWVKANENGTLTALTITEPKGDGWTGPLDVPEEVTRNPMAMMGLKLEGGVIAKRTNAEVKAAKAAQRRAAIGGDTADALDRLAVTDPDDIAAMNENERAEVLRDILCVLQNLGHIPKGPR